MRENGTGSSNEDTSFMVIGGGGGGGGGGADDERGNRHNFVRALDSKLKKLQRHHVAARTGIKQTSSSLCSRKPVFVTTVKTGIFLDPPPDLAALLGLDDRSSSSTVADSCNHLHRYYSYSSKPRVLYDKQHQRTSACIATRKTDRQSHFCKQMGYTNIMHDKRVVRGSNFAKKTYRPKWNPYFGHAKQLSSELSNESSAAREMEIRRRTMARKKAMDYQTRALRLHLGAPKLARDRQHVDIQTSTHLEELFEYPPCQTFGVQTEFDQETLSNPRTGMSTGTDASTQVDDKELFDFDTAVTPIAEALITDVFKQAILEILYEEELDARSRQQRALYLRRTIEEIENQRLEHEDERLNKVIANNAQLFDEKARMSELTSSRVVDVIPEVLSANGLTLETVKNPTELVSWLVDELQSDTIKHVDISDDTFKNIIDELVKHRLFTHNDIVIDVQSIKKPKELFEEIESITLQPDPKIDEDSRTDDS